MLNKQGPDKIDWCDYTWNPISGCLHGCSYCYVSKMDRLYGSKISQPQVHYNRLKDINKAPPNSKIFVCSSGDLLGDWVNGNDIELVINKMESRKDLNFITLTKNPRRYYDFDFPNNCIQGCSIDTNERANEFMKYGPEIDFVSFEPLLEKPQSLMLSFVAQVSWIIVGGESGGTPKPNEWADMLISIARNNNKPVWVKNNYKYHTRIKEHYFK